MSENSRKTEYKINGTTYSVTSKFSETSKEPLEKKLIKYLSDRVSEEINCPQTE